VQHAKSLASIRIVLDREIQKDPDGAIRPLVLKALDDLDDVQCFAGVSVLGREVLAQADNAIGAVVPISAAG
jgi:hypothetical protein